MSDAFINTHPAGAVGTTLSGRSYPEMLGAPGLIGTNTNSNPEAYEFGSTPVQSLSQRGLRHTLLQQAYQNSVETLSVKVLGSSARGTKVFDIGWGNFTRGTIQYLARAHTDCIGDTIHELRVVGNNMFTGVLIVAWVPTASSVVYTVEALEAHDYTLVTLNMTKNYTFVNHTSKTSGFFSTLGTDGKVVSADRVGRLIGLIHTELVPAATNDTAEVSIHITERLASPADATLGATPFQFNYTRSDADLAGVLTPTASVGIDNLYDAAVLAYDNAITFGVDSNIYFNSMNAKPTLPLEVSYKNLLHMFSINSIRIGANSKEETVTLPQDAELIYEQQSPALFHPPYSTTQRYIPTIGDRAEHANTIVINQYFGVFMGQHNYAATAQNTASSISELESMLIESFGCQYSYTVLCEVITDWQQRYSSTRTVIETSYEALENKVLVDWGGVTDVYSDPIYMRGTIVCIACVYGFRSDGSRVFVPIFDFKSNKCEHLLKGETVLETFSGDFGGKLSFQETFVGGIAVYDFAKGFFSEVRMTMRDNLYDGTLPVISSTTSSGNYQEPNNLRPLRPCPTGMSINPVVAGIAGSKSMTIPRSESERDMLRYFASIYKDRTLISVGDKTGNVTLELIFEPSIPALLVASPEFSILTLNRDNMYILTAVSAGPTTVPSSFPVWSSRVAPTKLSNHAFSTLRAQYSFKSSPTLGSAINTIVNESAAMVAAGAMQGGGTALGHLFGMKWEAKQSRKQRDFIADQNSQQREFLSTQAAKNRDFQMEMLLHGKVQDAVMKGGRASAYSGNNAYHPDTGGAAIPYDYSAQPGTSTQTFVSPMIPGGVARDRTPEKVIAPSTPGFDLHGPDYIPKTLDMSKIKSSGPKTRTTGTQFETGKLAATQTQNNLTTDVTKNSIVPPTQWFSAVSEQPPSTKSQGVQASFGHNMSVQTGNSHTYTSGTMNPTAWHDASSNVSTSPTHGDIGTQASLGSDASTQTRNSKSTDINQNRVMSSTPHQSSSPSWADAVALQVENDPGNVALALSNAPTGQSEI